MKFELTSLVIAPPIYKDVPLATDKVVFEYNTWARALLYKPNRHKPVNIITFEFMGTFFKLYNIKQLLNSIEHIIMCFASIKLDTSTFKNRIANNNYTRIMPNLYIIKLIKI